MTRWVYAKLGRQMKSAEIAVCEAAVGSNAFITGSKKQEAQLI
jgi:hypothetical protein